MLEERQNIPAWKIKFWKLLYRSYKSNKGASSILQHRITPLGYMVAIILVIAMTLRLGASRNVLFAIIACLGATLCFSFVCVFLRRVRMGVRRIVPKMGSVGKPLRYQVEITSKQGTTITSTVLREIPAWSYPSEDVFVYSVEPGEEARNAFDRLFIVYRWKWLTGSRMGFLAHDSSPVKVEPRGVKKIQMSLIPKRRGLLQMSQMKALLPDPLYLFQRCVHLKQSEDSVLILPKRYAVHHLQILGETQNQTGGEAQSRQVGQSSEFVSLRDYRPGDPIKHVDWKSWAKTGEPVVREYEDVYFPRHGLVLDTGLHPTLHEHFEEAVSVAASFASSINTDEGLLDLVLIQQDAKVITAGKGVERLDHMLEVLACADIETTPNWDELSQRVIQVAPDFSGCVMVFGDWSKERADLVNLTASMGTVVICLLIYSDLEEAEQALKKFAAAVKVHLLKVGQIQKDLDRALGSI